MAGYISREAARPDAFCSGVSCQECPFCKDIFNGGCRVDDFIMSLPAANVQPVVRGKWIWIKDNAYHVCSNCAGVMNYDPEKGFFIFNTLPNFCPNCGADMREIKDD